MHARINVPDRYSQIPSNTLSSELHFAQGAEKWELTIPSPPGAMCLHEYYYTSKTPCWAQNERARGMWAKHPNNRVPNRWINWNDLHMLMVFTSLTAEQFSTVSRR